MFKKIVQTLNNIIYIAKSSNKINNFNLLIIFINTKILKKQIN